MKLVIGSENKGRVIYFDSWHEVCVWLKWHFPFECIKRDLRAIYEEVGRDVEKVLDF